MGQPGAIAPSRPNTMVPGAQLLLAVAAHFRAQRASRAPIASRPIGALLDRDRDGLLVFFVGVVLLRVAAAVYFLTHLLVAAAPVVHLASLVTVSHFASYTPRSVVGQWGGAGGAVCEDHFALAGRL